MTDRPMANPTPGLQIEAIQLLGCATEFDGVPPGGGDFDAKFELKNQYSVDGDVIKCRVQITVHFDDRTEAPDIFVARCEYGGAFRRQGHSPVSVQQVAELHGPAILYAFCREHVHDLFRRANLPALLLPPMAFVNPSPAETNSGSETRPSEE